MSVSSYADEVNNYDTVCATNSQVGFTAEKIVWDKFSDTNQGNYNSNYVNFSSLSSAGISPDVIQSWNQAEFEIPIQATLEILDLQVFDGTGTLTDAEIAADRAKVKFDTTITNQQLGLCLKNNIHLVDNLQVKWSNIQVTQNENYQNIYRYLNLLSWNNDKYEKYGRHINYVLDKGNTIGLGNCGEINNTSSNTAHAERCSFNNHYDLTNDVYNNNLKDNIAYNKLGGIVEVTDTKLTYHWFVREKLALQHDFFNALPSLGAVMNFDIRMQMNVGIASSWIVTYKVEIGDTSKKIESITPYGIEYMKGAGNCCPFMIGELGTTTALRLSDETFTKKGVFFLRVKLSTVIGSKTDSQQPCRIYMPSIKYDPSILGSKLSGTTKIFYNDYILERLEDERKIVSGAKNNIKITFNNNLSKVSKLFIIPILANSANNLKTLNTDAKNDDKKGLLLPYESPLSSCPNTFNGGFRFKDIMLLLGNQRIYPEKITDEHDFYHNAVASFFSQTKSNLVQDTFYSTQLTLDRWRYGYGIYVFDVVNTVNESNFSAPRSWQLEYSSDSKYDFNLLCFFQQEKNCVINLATGELVNE